LKLLPRSVPLGKREDESVSPSAGESSHDLPEMSEEKAKAKISEDVKEFWQVRDVTEAVSYFKDLPATYHEQLVNKFVSDVINMKEADVVVIADLFTQSVAAGNVSTDALKKGLSETVEFLDDIAVDVPQAYPFMAKLMKGATLSKEDVEELGAKISTDGDPVVSPKDKLLKEYEKLA